MRRAMGCSLLTMLAMSFASVVAAQDRLPPLAYDELTQDQRAAWEEYGQVRDGGTPGGPPWSVILRVPELLGPSVRMRLQNQRGDSPLPQIDAELVILMTAREWTQHYEWNAHSRAALRLGMDESVVDAIREGRRPDRMSREQEVLWDFTHELLHNKSVTDETYARAVQTFSEEATVEIAAVAGYYTYLAMIMNMARTPAESPMQPFPN